MHFLLGKVYMELKRDRNALEHFNIAMDLNRDSKDYHTIKTKIEQLKHVAELQDPEPTPLPPPSEGPPAMSRRSGGGPGPDNRLELSHLLLPAGSSVGGSPHPRQHGGGRGYHAGSGRPSAGGAGASPPGQWPPQGSHGAHAGYPGAGGYYR